MIDRDALLPGLLVNLGAAVVLIPAGVWITRAMEPSALQDAGETDLASQIDSRLKASNTLRAALARSQAIRISDRDEPSEIAARPALSEVIQTYAWRGRARLMS